MPDPGQLALLIPIIVMLIPIVAILTSHQQKMATIIHGPNGTGNRDGEIQALRMEVQELKQLIHQQAISIDTMAGLSARQSPPAMPYEERPVKI